MSAKKRNKIGVAAYQQAIEGITKYLWNTPLLINGRPVDKVIEEFQNQIYDIERADFAREEWLQAVADERETANAISVPLYARLRRYVAAAFPNSTTHYRAFGFEPPKPRTKSRKAGKARKTKGSKQRLQVADGFAAKAPAKPAK